MKQIHVSDTTLKKLCEKRDVALLFREKTAIAACADSLGADAVELPAVKNVREDTIIYKTIAKNVRHAALVIPVGFTEEDVVRAWECVKDAARPKLQIEVPVSTLQMEYTYHIKSDKMLTQIGTLIRAAKALCPEVEFSALDATRADEEFLLAAAREAEAGGAVAITLCDDAGASLPAQIASLSAKVKTEVQIPVYVQTSDRIHMAVASALAAIEAGADGVKCAMAGGDGLVPHRSEVMERELEQLRTYYDISVRDVMCLDSSNIRPEEWQQLARHIFENFQDYDGIVVSHGTDTMAYTASALSFSLENLDKPVIITG